MSRALLVAALVLAGCNSAMQRGAVVRATDMMSKVREGLAAVGGTVCPAPAKASP